ncbi:hypothetical protein, partial [Bacteroides xylanisolvens]|uniref:hypothetical protein n=1 Tax=Bacteroides xylanisolvens TaxID=371601 RepID=UPI0035644E1C
GRKQTTESQDSLFTIEEVPPNLTKNPFSVEARMEIVFSLSPYLLKQIFNAVPLIKPLIICRFR